MLEPMFDPALLGPERVRPLHYTEFEMLFAQGAFRKQHVELLRGVLVQMSPQGEPHARITAWLAMKLARALSIDEYDVRSHSSFLASEISMPEPDVLVGWRVSEGPHRGNALLLIEVANTSLHKDRVIKNEIYAEAGVPEYWIVDVKSSRVEVLTEPSETGYTKSSIHRRGDILRQHKLASVSIAVADIPWQAPSPRRRSSRK
jgi:Uma2 family endonuclease